MKKYISAFLFLLFFTQILAQGEGNHWYFGYNAGLDFSSGTPVADLNGAMNTWEGCSAVSNKAGQLLFYTDGGTVYTKTHTVMPNGTGLLGNSSSTQSAIIVKKPGSDSLYYIFTTPQVSSGGFYYSIVDLSLNGGLGDIIVSSKNTNLLPVVGERVTATKHSNGIYSWVITKVTNTNAYYAYLIDCNGVQSPVITNIGLTGSGNNAGSTIASPNGKKVASTFFSTTNAIEILDFDNSSGVFSNAITNSESGYPYGGCFSPNSNLFYFSNIASGNLTQLDLTAGNGAPAAVLASATVVGNISGTGAGGFRAGNLQLAANGKMYMAENGQGNIAVVNNPDVPGTACNFVGNSVSLGGKTCGLGLPAFFLNFIDTTVIDYQFTCFTLPTAFRLHGDTTALDSVRWDFGDIASGTSNFSTLYSPTHTFTAAGNYNVQLIRFYTCGSDTNHVSVTIVPNNLTAVITGSDSICESGTLNLSASGGAHFSWSGPNGFSDTLYSISVPNIQTSGAYTVIVYDNNGCTDTTQSNIFVLPLPIATASSNSPIPVGGIITLLTDTIAGVSWSGPNGFTTNNQNPTISNAQLSHSGYYQIIKTNIWGCSDTATTQVYVYQPEIPDNTIDDDGDGLVDCADPDLATLHQCYRCGYDSIAWKTVIPESGFNRAISVKYTGYDQYFVVPAGVTSIKIKAWGAGGGGSAASGENAGAGAGGYVEGVLNVSAGSTFSLMVGEGGACDGTADNSSYGFGGSYGTVAFGGFGGGLSGVFTPGTPLTDTDFARALLIAGGGGGSEKGSPSTNCSSGGQGGDPIFGGTMPTMLGESGNPKVGGGGGGGYHGGAMTLRLSGDGVTYAGEGGSNFIHSSVGSATALFSTDFGSWNAFPLTHQDPPNTSDPHYIPWVSTANPGIGTGIMTAYSRSGNGLIVIQWLEPLQNLTITASKDSICSGDTLSLTANGGGTFSWSPATSLSNSTDSLVIAQPQLTTTYQVISNDNNCMDTADISIVVNSLPIANFSVSNVCQGITSVFNDSSSVNGDNITNWYWSFGDNSSAAQSNPTHSYDTCGTYNILLKVTTTSGCVDSVTKSSIIYCLPMVDAGLNDSLCFSENTTLAVQPNGIGYSYSWSYLQVNNFSAIYNPTVSPVLTTTYSVVVTDSNSCSSADSVMIFVNPQLQLNPTVSNVTCNASCNGKIALNASGGSSPFQYNWSTGCVADSCNSLCPGTYSVTLTDAWGCVAQVDTTITEPPVLFAFINTFSNTLCNNSCDGSASIVASGGTPIANSYLYSWNSIPIQNTSTASNLCSGTYICSVIDSNSCVAKDTVVINSPPAITIITTSTPTKCDENTGSATIQNIIGGTPGYSFTWSADNQADQTITALASGDYTVTVTDTNACMQSQTVHISHTNAPTSGLVALNTIITGGSTTVLTATGGGAYDWYPASTLTCDTCQIVTAKPQETTEYCVVVSDTNHCKDTSCIVITVDFLCNELVVPNAFSPNGDGHNDLLVLHGWDKCVSDFSMMIFDRWGEKVFQSNNPVKSWDGAYKPQESSAGSGRQMNSNVFVYYINATLFTGEKVTKQGNITIIN